MNVLLDYPKATKSHQGKRWFLEAQTNQKGIGLLTKIENRQKSQTEGPDLGYVWLSLKGVLGNKSQALHSQLCDWRIKDYGDVSW